MTAAAKTNHANEREHRRELAEKINALLVGRINTVGSLTLLAGTTSTVITDANAHPNCMPILTATNAPAAQLVGGAIGVRVSARNTGSFTLTHGSPASDCTFLYALLG